MYFADVSQLQSHLNNDWTILLKNIKLMEDTHYQLLQYNKRILDKQPNQDEDPFINDQILQHHQRISSVTQHLNAVQQEHAEIEQKYGSSPVSYQEIAKLMGRVGARILETYQYSIDKCKSFGEELLDRHLKMKATLIRMLNQKEKLNLQEIIAHVVAYSHNKLLNEVEALRKIVAALQSGEYGKGQGSYQFKQKPAVPTERKPTGVSAVSLEKKNLSVEKSKVSSVGRDQRVSPVWEQLKAQERLKKQKQKAAIRLVHGLYSTMDLARQQIIEDICSNEREKSKRLYNEIFSRNRFNHDQIIAFQARSEDFQEKVRLFKQQMELESKRLAEAIRKPSVKREKRRVDNLNFSRMEVDHSEEERREEGQLPPSDRKSGSNRYRIQSPKSRPKPNEHPIIIQASQENFSHIKFQSAAQSTYLRPLKNKLPFLYHQNLSQAVTRAASFDQRPQLSRPKQLRHQASEVKGESSEVLNQEAVAREKMRKEEKYLVQRAKVPLKNIEVRVDGVMRQEVSPAGREPRIKPNPIEYTFYVRRSNRFYEPNHNIIL